MSIFVIFNYGLDYNDETHEIGGEGAEVLRTGYKTLDDAKTALKEKLKDNLKGFGIRDFGWEGGREYPEATEWLEFLTESDNHYCGWGKDSCINQHNWAAFIKYCEDNDVEWLNRVPQLLCIQEIDV